MRTNGGVERLIESNDGQVGSVFGIEDRECVANADLIAAAPELLACLFYLHQETCPSKDGEIGSIHLERIRNSALKAIQKATAVV